MLRQGKAKTKVEVVKARGAMAVVRAQQGALEPFFFSFFLFVFF